MYLEALGLAEGVIWTHSLSFLPSFSTYFLGLDSNYFLAGRSALGYSMSLERETS
jgi:hypothetical protein